MRLIVVLASVLILTMLSTVARAETVALETRTERIDLSNNMMLLHDTSANLHYKEVLDMENAFRKVQRQDLIKGFNAGVFWLRFSLVHAGAQPVTRWLVVGTAKINLVTVFVQNQQEWQVMRSGRSVPLAEKPIVSADAVFPIMLNPGQNLEVLIRVVVRGATDMSTALWEPQAYRFDSGERKLLTVAMLAGVLVSSVLALIVYVRLREAPYLWLSLLLFAIAAVESARENLISFYLWPEDQLVPLQVLSVFAGLAIFSLSKVVAATLELQRQLPVADRLFFVLRWVGVAAIPLSFMSYGIGVRILAFNVVILHLASLVLPIVLWQRGFRPALWFAAVFSLGLLVETARQLANLGILPWAEAMNFSLAGYLLASPLILFGMIEKTRKLSEQLAMAEQLQQAKSAFLARVSHELRSPLNTILGFARMLRRGSERLPLSDGTEGIEKSALRLLSLIEELLDETRVAAGTLSVSPVPTLIVPWLNELCAATEIIVEAKGNRFVSQCAEVLPLMIEFDGKRVRQVLENLLNNANRHTRQGEIRLVCKMQVEGQVALLYFSVQDTGEGIAPKYIKDIFEPFTRGKQADGSERGGRSGFGLGLSISRELIRQMGSDIVVSSELNKGSCFSFTLQCPLQNAAQDAQATAEDFATEVSAPEFEVNEQVINAAQWQELAALAEDGDVSGVEDWIDALDALNPKTAPVESWARTAIYRLDFDVLHRTAIHVLNKKNAQ